MKILGIDPGSLMGFGTLVDQVRVESGTWDFRNKRKEGGGMPFLRAGIRFKAYVLATQPDVVAFEEVRRHMGVDAAHAYGGYMATCTAICEELHIPWQSVPVTQVKRTATGKGNASKEMMVAAAIAKWNYAPVDDNDADACWMAYHLGQELQITT